MFISCDDAAFGYGDNLIFSHVTFSINEGERIGLIGANGEGKTTLIKLLSGELEADAGVISRKNGLRIGYLEQTGGYSSGNTVYEEMRGIFREETAAVEKLFALSAKLADTPFPGREYDALSAKIEGLNKLLSARDGFDTDVKIKTVLNGLGFAGMYDRVIDTMSGGEKTRLKLARLLLEAPDLLILDEPTNHLDIATLYWLEEYLQAFKGAIFVVSHDRYFISALADAVAEIEGGRLNYFSGGYELYIAEKRLEGQASREAEESQKAEKKDAEKSSYRSKKERAADEKRKELTKKLEAEISACEREESEINALLSDPATAADYTRVSALADRLETIKLQLDGLYKQYEEVL